MKRRRVRERDEAAARDQAEARAQDLLARLRDRQAAEAQPVIDSAPADGSPPSADDPASAEPAVPEDEPA